MYRINFIILNISVILVIELNIIYIEGTTEVTKPKLIDPKQGDVIIKWLLIHKYNETQKPDDIELPSYDGWYHDLTNICSGSTDQPLLYKNYESKIQKSYNHILEKLIVFENCFENATFGLLNFFLGKQVLLEIMNVRLENEPKNLATPFIDGGIIYGHNRYNSYLSRVNGTNMDQNGHLISYDLEKYANKSIPAALARIWLLWHNKIANIIKGIKKDWTSEDIFNEARKWTIAVQQNIFMYEWLPFWINVDFPPYIRYNPTINPQIEILFYAAMFGLNFANGELPKSPVLSDINSLMNTFFSNRRFANITINLPYSTFPLPSLQHAYRVLECDIKKCLNTENLLNKLKSFGLNDLDLTSVDALLGGLLETDKGHCGNGQLFETIIKNQFLRIRNGDRFWFENQDNMLFSEIEISKIRLITFNDIYISVKNFAAYNNIDTPNFGLIKIVEQITTHNRPTVLLISVTMVFSSVMVLIIIIWIWKNGQVLNINKREDHSVVKNSLGDQGKLYHSFLAKEYVGKKNGLRKILVTLKLEEKQVVLNSYSGIIIRVIDCNTNSRTLVQVYILFDKPILVIKFSHNYDLVLQFQTEFLRQEFLNAFDEFLLKNSHLEKELINNFNWRAVKDIIVSKEHRQSWLEMFFRVAFAQAFKIKHSKDEMLRVDAFLANKVIHTELTKFEFADALNMNPDTQFVTRMFTLVDKDKNGFISFREFLDLIIVFADVNEEKKAKLLFDMYDIDGTGFLHIDDFSAMIKSFMENIGRQQGRNIQETINYMLHSANIQQNKFLDFEKFKKIIGEDIKYLSYAKLGFKMEKCDNEPYLLFARRILETMNCETNDSQNIIQEFTIQQDESYLQNQQQTFAQRLLQFAQSYSNLLFWVVLLTLSIVYIFVNNLSLNAESMDSFQGNYSVCISSADTLLFSYSILLISMCRNIWSALDTPVVKKYWPYNSLTVIHVYVCFLSVFFTVLHITTAIYVFYIQNEILNQTSIGTNLLLYEPQSDWFQIFDITILTGIILTGLSCAMFIFLFPCLRFKFFSIFHKVHKCYVLIIILLIFHGSQRKFQAPKFFYFMSGPLLLYFIDTFITVNRKIIEVPIFRVEIHPSNVICIIMRRPENFQYKIGQNIRLSIPVISLREYHQYSLSSAPCESDLRIYIPVIDCWSQKVFALFDGAENGQKVAPVRVRLEGPLDNGIEDWGRYDIVIFIGGGNGITPFSAVLKDISHYLKVKASIRCQKVFFIWTSKTQKHFEWLVDLIQETENNDPNGFFSCHIFITEPYEKFDLRTILSYICEKYYRRVFGRSLFMHLRAITHFSRPHFPEIFSTIKSIHTNAIHFGVFSSGPSNLIQAVGKACTQMNCQNKERFEHHANIF